MDSSRRRYMQQEEGQEMTKIRVGSSERASKLLFRERGHLRDTLQWLRDSHRTRRSTALNSGTESARVHSAIPAFHTSVSPINVAERASVAASTGPLRSLP